MKHVVLNQLDYHPFEVIRIKLLSDNEQETVTINNKCQVTDYLITVLGAIDIFHESAPEFVIKRVKENIGSQLKKAKINFT